MRDMQQNVAYISLSFFFFLDDRRHFHAVQSDGRIKASQAYFFLYVGGREGGTRKKEGGKEGRREGGREGGSLF